MCQCKNSFTIENEQQSITVVNVCAGISIPPCISDDSDIGSKVKHISLYIHCVGNYVCLFFCSAMNHITQEMLHTVVKYICIYN